MPAPKKPNVPWAEIAERWQSGETSYSIAKSLEETEGRVSKQAIDQMAERQGWTRNTAISEQVSVNLDDIRDDLSKFHKATLWAIKHTLECYAEGATHEVAAASISVSVETLRRWRENSSLYAEAVDNAYASHAIKSMKVINRAAELGDWKAADKMLTKNPLTKDTFGESKGQGFNLQVVLNIPDPKPAIEGEVHVLQADEG